MMGIWVIVSEHLVFFRVRGPDETTKEEKIGQPLFSIPWENHMSLLESIIQSIMNQFDIYFILYAPHELHRIRLAQSRSLYIAEVAAPLQDPCG